jgi:hypothetical protein
MLKSGAGWITTNKVMSKAKFAANNFSSNLLHLIFEQQLTP